MTPKAKFHLKIVDIRTTVLEVFVSHDRLLQWNIGFNVLDNQLVLRITHTSDSDVTVFTVCY